VVENSGAIPSFNIQHWHFHAADCFEIDLEAPGFPFQDARKFK
jgi:hypothetical protein